MIAPGNQQASPSLQGSPDSEAGPRIRRHRLLLLVIIGIGCFFTLFAFRTFVLHYYPSPPFIYDEGDSLADWTNTCSWSDRTDRYTIWQSLYTPFSHFLCTIANLIFGQIPPDYFASWRQFSPIMKYIVAFHLCIWLTILIPIKPFDSNISFRLNLKRYFVTVFPFRLITLLSYAALFSFERGNTLSIAYLFIWLSLRAVYYPSCRVLLHPILVGAAAAIKPYILIFSLYGRRFSGLVIAFLTVVVLQIIPVLIVGAPGIENLPANLAYFSRENSILDVIAKALNSFSFRSYLDMKKLVHYGVGAELLGVNYDIYLNTLYLFGLFLFLVLIFLAARCLITAINIDRRELIFFRSSSDTASSNLAPSDQQRYNARLVMMRYAVPSFINITVFMIFSQSSGAYVVLFLFVAIFCIEEETFIISRSPILLTLYFMGICAFDLPAFTNKAYDCGLRSISLDAFRQIPLISELTGHQYICLGTYIGFVSLARPIFFLLFGCFLLLKLRRNIKLSHLKIYQLHHAVDHSETNA
jgi:hypothetical protein